VADAPPDIIDDHLAVLFCGVNPGLEAAATGRHFAGRSNRFWRAIHLAGFTPEKVAPQNDRTILQHGCGLTTVVERPTARADQLAPLEYAAAADAFERKVARYAPRFVAFLGKAAYSALSGRRDIVWGLQSTPMAASAIWVLPNPSGRNRAFTLEQLVGAYRELHAAAFAVAPSLSR
jgi:double-stranded uracil-DNA glycosylase